MAHFTKINKNIVETVVVIANADCLDVNLNESESVGVNKCVELVGGSTNQVDVCDIVNIL